MENKTPGLSFVEVRQVQQQGQMQRVQTHPRSRAARLTFLNPDTTKAVKEVTATVAIIAAALTGGIYFSNEQLAPAPVKTITLTWDRNSTDTNVTTEVWSSTNLVTWQLRTNIFTNRVTVPMDKACEFFKVRNRQQVGPNVYYTDWARKPGL